MKLHSIILILLLPLVSISQTADTLIIKDVKKNKEYIIQPWHELVLTPKGDSLKKREFFGSIVKQTQDSIWIDASMQIITISNLDTNNKPLKDSVIFKLYEESSIDFEYDYQKIIFAKANCKSLKWDKTPGNRILYHLLFTNSLGTALLISPLISINYKTWNFNTKRFLWVSGVSTITATISFSLFKTAGVKRFNFNSSQYQIK